jgi:Holliday junction resolvase
MGCDLTRKGPRGEAELSKLLARIDGVSVRRQPGSGSIGSRSGTRNLRGDLRLAVGDMTFRCEVKRRKTSPQVLERWLSGVEVLAIRADHEDWRFYLPRSIFVELLALAADGLSARTDR